MSVGNCTIRTAVADDVPALAATRVALWPELDARHAAAELQAMLAEPERMLVLIAAGASAGAIGFAEASVRRDHVNGTERSPVGFLEGLYVAPAARRRGVGRALVAAVEAWASECGCDELASDALLDNRTSHALHVACGFRETERVVYFVKRAAAGKATAR